MAVPTRAPWQRRQGCGPLLQAPEGRLGRLGHLAACCGLARGSGSHAHAGRDRTDQLQQDSATNEENAVIEGLSPDEYEYYYEDLPSDGAPAAAPAQP